MSVIDHNHPKYKQRWRTCGMSRYNGAYYYSREIVKYIIPNVETERNWVTILQPGECLDHSIFFVHNNLRPDRYEFIKKFDDVILVCGVPETVEKVNHIAPAIYLPLSVKVDEIEKYKVDKKDRDTALVGRKNKIRNAVVPDGIDWLCDMEREKLLRNLAHYKKVYAVGRTAIEAKVLGCEVLPYDERYPDPSVWKVVDSLEAADMLQKALDEIDGK